MNSSIIIEKINKFFAIIQEFMRPVVSSSLLLQRFDYLILLFLVVFFALSLFLPTIIMGCIGAFIVLLTIIKLFIVRGQNIEVTPSSLLLAGYFIICVISIFFSEYTWLSIKGCFEKTFIYLAFYFSMVQFFRFNKNKINFVMFVLAAIVSFEALYAILQSLGPQEINTAWQDTSYVNPEETLSRVYGSLENANLLSAYLMVGLANINTVAFMAFLGKHKKTFSLSIAFLILTLVAIFLTGCRGGYVAIFCMFVAAFLLINYILKAHFTDKVKSAWKKVCLCFVGMGACAIVFSPAILKRILSIFIMGKDSSTSFRMQVYKAAWKMFKDNWFTGIGVGNETFRNVYGLYMTSGYNALSAYSVYLEIALESGIFALMFFIGYFVSIIKSVFKALKDNIAIEQKAIIVSIFVMIIGVAVHGFFDTVFFRPQVQFLFWINMAMLTVIVEEKREVRISQSLVKIGKILYNKVEKICNEVKNKWEE